MAALRHARAARRIALDEYLGMLRALPAPPAERLRLRRGPNGPPLDLRR